MYISEARGVRRSRDGAGGQHAYQYDADGLTHEINLLWATGDNIWHKLPSAISYVFRVGSVDGQLRLKTQTFHY